jgi:hypothetical protein
VPTGGPALRAPLLAARSDVPHCFARNLSTAMWAGLSRAWVGLEPSPGVVILWRSFTGVLPLLALSPVSLCSLSSLSTTIWVARSVAADLPPHLAQQRASQRRRLALRQPARLAGQQRHQGTCFRLCPRLISSCQISSPFYPAIRS